MFEGIMEWMYGIVQNLGSAVLALLPASPFRGFIDDFVPPTYLGWLNWFFPVQSILIILGIWLSSIALFYLYSIIMRWVKMIGD